MDRQAQHYYVVLGVVIKVSILSDVFIKNLLRNQPVAVYNR